MKICVAQTRPFKGNIEKNIQRHKELIKLAASYEANAIFFPELSLTGYEPQLAKTLCIHEDDSILNDFQQISDLEQIIIGVGMPVKSNTGIYISMLIFQPQKSRQQYCKQTLHNDELPYFIEGQQQVFITGNDIKIAPAICYESLLPAHADNAFKSGANVYIASVAKSKAGVEKAFVHFPEIAAKYSITVLMANCVGPSDDFESAGKTSIWNNRGELLAQLNDINEGLLIIDTNTGELIKETVNRPQTG